MSENYQALVLYNEAPRSRLETLAPEALPEQGDVLVRVTHSSLNYKDALAVTGKGPIVRSYPFVPGIDLAGVVVSSDDPKFKSGDAVLATGWGIGERFWGGYASHARLRGEWLTALPEGLDAEHAMAIGTAGLTAMLCVMALETHGLPSQATVAVSGATGGVGSIALALLAAAGHRVAAITGRPEAQEAYLRGLGAHQVLPRSDFSRSAKPLERETWDGAVDTAGGSTLATLISQMRYRCCITAVGLAESTELNTSVFPFILRNVNLQGVDSVQCPIAVRSEAWQRLARELSPEVYQHTIQRVALSDIPEVAEAMIAGQTHGRTVVVL